MTRRNLAFSVVIICFILFVLFVLYRVADRLQTVAQEHKPLQEVYTIYQDDILLCYRVTKGVDLAGQWHDESQQCLRK